jgi:hypothetical protein
MAVEILKSNPVYRKAFRWIVENSKSNTLPYHNITHLMTVFESCYDASEHYNFEDIYSSESAEIELCLAALFHDVNHSGGKLTDDKNVATAIKSFNDFYETLSDEEKSMFNKDEVIETIKPTQYPYEITDNSELTLKQRILRDADLTSAFNGDWFQTVVYGLKEEMGVPTLQERINQQVNFILGLKPCTDWGKSKLEGCKGRLLNELANISSMLKDESTEKLTPVAPPTYKK